MEEEIGKGNVGRRVCIDTDVCIEIIKNSSRINTLDRTLLKPSISTITIFELLLRRTNLEAANKFIDSVEILDFDANAARKASDSFKQLSKKGIIVDYRDLFIAAIAISNNYELITLNKKDFENVDGLKLVEF